MKTKKHRQWTKSLGEQVREYADQMPTKRIGQTKGDKMSWLLKAIGWQKVLGAVWDLIDDEIRSKVKASDNQIDDKVFEIADMIVKKLTEVKML